MTAPDAWVDLAPPAGWARMTRGGLRTAEAPSGLVAVQWSRLVLAAPDEHAAILDPLRTAAPREGGVRIESQEAAETVYGWPVTLIEARFFRGDGGDAGAAFGAFYRFLAFRGYALALAASTARLHAALAELRPAMLAARPDVARLFLGPCDFFDVSPATAP